MGNFAPRVAGEFFKRIMADRGIKKLMNATKSTARENFFARNAGQALPQEIEQLHFAIGARSKVRGPAFRGRRVIARPIPKKHRFAKPGARGDQRLIGVRLRNYFVQREKIVWRQFVYPTGGGDQIVNEPDVLDSQAQLGRESRGVQDPRKIDRVQAAIEHGSRDPETCRYKMRVGFHPSVLRGFLAKGVDELLEAGEIARGITVLEDKFN